ncbi:MAG: universal stress protein [Acidobacteriota bacterium]
MRIVVATDGSRGGTAAVRFAARLAAGDPGAELILLTIGGRPAAPPRSGSAPPSANDILSDAALEVRTMGVTGRCRLLTLRTRREIPEAISAFADRLRADLVVVGSEGRDTLAEWVVGGVALRLIYVAKLPVVVVRPTRRHRAA